MVLSERIKELVVGLAPEAEIAQVAREEGMLTLREAGLAKVRAGVTSIEESPASPAGTVARSSLCPGGRSGEPMEQIRLRGCADQDGQRAGLRRPPQPRLRAGHPRARAIVPLDEYPPAHSPGRPATSSMGCSTTTSASASRPTSRSTSPTRSPASRASASTASSSAARSAPPSGASRTRSRASTRSGCRRCSRTSPASRAASCW